MMPAPSEEPAAAEFALIVSLAAALPEELAAAAAGFVMPAPSEELAAAGL